MIDRPSGGESVILVHVNFPAGKMKEDLEEFKELALSAGARIVAVITTTRSVPEAKYFIGSGKADEIKAQVLTTCADLVIFNHALSPAQERNLERLLQCRVLDRTGLILDIFAQRARTFEGKLQVELAQLNHLATRLIRGWTHLERQRGGIGLRGPGETQLETDRRLIRTKIKQITARLAKLRQQRELGRRARRKAIIPTVALVGYTNAGKSTLFNQLAGSDIYVANQLFATLDPTLRRISLPEFGPVILADTVGFIRHLPHKLIEAFHATLEEVSAADLLLHIVDAHDEQRFEQMDAVTDVLNEIRATAVPKMIVYNKIDLTDQKPRLEYGERGEVKKIFVSAKSNEGITLLKQAVSQYLSSDMVTKEVILSPMQAKLRANLYAREAVLSERVDEAGNLHLQIRMSRVEFARLFR